MNTENVKVRILDKEKRTTLTIKRTTKEDDAIYVCKATSEIGMTVTKARLHVDSLKMSETKPDDVMIEETKQDIKKPEEKLHRRKKTEIKKAKEIKEKIKAERVKIEKEIHEETLVPKEQPEEKSVILYSTLTQHFDFYISCHITIF